ncbi:hypothetical protein ACWC9T_32570 [Kitasatospora sp. NPDC001159]
MREAEDDVGGAGADVGAGAAGVVGGEEVVADGRAEGEQGTGLDLVGVGVEDAGGVAYEPEGDNVMSFGFVAFHYPAPSASRSSSAGATRSPR